MVLECLGVWLCVIWSCDALSLHNSTCSLGSLVFTCLSRIKEAHNIERAITLKYYIYKFINYEQNIYMNVTYLNLVLGVPLTHFYHLSAFLQVSSVELCSLLSKSAYTGTAIWEQAD